MKLRSIFFEPPNYDELYKANKNSYFGQLPTEILMKVLGFCGPGDLARMALVYKNISKQVKKIFDLAPVYYCLGNNISIYETGCSYFKRLSPQKIKEETIKSISSSPKDLKIFLTMADALEYSRFLRARADDLSVLQDDITQPAVFTIKYLGIIPDIDWKHETITINTGSRHATTYDETERKIDVRYFTTNSKNICVMSGQLKIHKSNKDEFKEYLAIDFRQDFIEIRKILKPGCTMI